MKLGTTEMYWRRFLFFLSGGSEATKPHEKNKNRRQYNVALNLMVAFKSTVQI